MRRALRTLEGWRREHRREQPGGAWPCRSSNPCSMAITGSPSGGGRRAVLASVGTTASTQPAEGGGRAE